MGTKIRVPHFSRVLCARGGDVRQSEAKQGDRASNFAAGGCRRFGFQKGQIPNHPCFSHPRHLYSGTPVTRSSVTQNGPCESLTGGTQFVTVNQSFTITFGRARICKHLKVQIKQNFQALVAVLVGVGRETVSIPKMGA